MHRSFRVLKWPPAPWPHTTTTLPPLGDQFYKKLGSSIVKKMSLQDAGGNTYHECLVARRHLEIVLRNCGFPDLEVKFFGGLVSLGFFEVSGDLDFVAVGDCEPTADEAAAIVQRVAREMRRIGLKPMGIPRARVPVVRCDRASTAMPGSPLPAEAASVMFPFSRPLTPEERNSFDARMTDKFRATSLAWRNDGQCVCCTFRDTTTSVLAMATVKRHGEVDIPVRAPLDARSGSELYRFPFDLCFGSSGLLNTFAMRTALTAYPGARHILLALKRWGKSCGNINSMDGYLASYAYTSLLTHYLLQMDRIGPVDATQMIDATTLPNEPKYIPLEPASKIDLDDVGYLFAHFFHYYGKVFPYQTNVVNCTQKELTKDVLKWANATEGDAAGKPPYYDLAMKDPYGKENIARAIDVNRLKYIQESFVLALHALEVETADPEFVLAHLTEDAPRPSMKQPLSAFETEDARRLLVKQRMKQVSSKRELYGKAAQQDRKQHVLASDITQSVMGWLGTNKQEE
eukprot:PhF_6_TR37901/c0_g1_i1/m.56595